MAGKPKSDQPIVWLVEREFIFSRRWVPVATLPPSATKADAEFKRSTLPSAQLYRVARDQRLDP